MTDIVNIKLENEMDLILAHKRTMKLAELCGINLITQTTFATAVSEVSRCVIGKDKRSSITLAIAPQKGNRKNLLATLVTGDEFGKDHREAVKYASRLTSNVEVLEEGGQTNVSLTLGVPYGGLINDAKIQSFIDFFKKEMPLSPYDEIRKKNIQLLEISEKLKESENQYKGLTETLPLMMFTTNAAGYLTYGNKWLKDYFNMQEIQPGKVVWLSLVHSADNRLVRDDWEKSLSGQAVFRAQAKLKGKTSHEPPLWHLISVLPVKNENKEVVSWTGFFVDIHAQKQIEETLQNNVELKAAQKQLLNSQQRLEEKVAELNKSNHDLEQFAYIASHDLQEPLRKIRTFTEMVEKHINEPAKAMRFIEKIDSSSLRMLSLIKDVLNYSRLSKTDTTFEDVDLNEIIQNVKSDLELTLEEKQAVIESAKLPVVSGIKQQLFQLFYNLTTNSLKFTQDKPVIKIRVRDLSPAEVKENENLHVSFKYIEISFEDNGIGFEQKYERQIFTIFKRLNSRDSYAGTGIGLALCKKIVDNHHGLIRASGEPGKGAKFIITLPVN